MKDKMDFKTWLEARTYRDNYNTKVVYHLNKEGEWKEVLRKQDIGLWVAPNLGADLSWAPYVGSSGRGQVVYLYKIGMPRWLFDKLMTFERKRYQNTNPKTYPGPRHVNELVITPKYWKLLTPLSIKKYSRADIIRRGNRQNSADAQREKKVLYYIPRVDD